MTLLFASFGFLLVSSQQTLTPAATLWPVIYCALLAVVASSPMRPWWSKQRLHFQMNGSDCLWLHRRSTRHLGEVWFLIWLAKRYDGTILYYLYTCWKLQCLFVCLLACLLVCLFVCLFVCYLLTFLNIHSSYVKCPCGVPRKSELRSLVLIGYKLWPWYFILDTIDGRNLSPVDR